MKQRLLLFFLAALALAGCPGTAPPVPRDHYYRVMVPPPQRDGVPRLPGILAVAPLEADGLLRERPLLYSASGQAFEMQQHDYHYWIDPPPRMLQAQLIDYLRGSGIASAVIFPDVRVKSDYELSGRIRRLERLLSGGPPRVVAEIELTLVDSANKRLILVQNYSAEVISADPSVAASITALNTALAQIFARFLNDPSWRSAAEVPANSG